MGEFGLKSMTAFPGKEGENRHIKEDIKYPLQEEVTSLLISGF